MPHRIIIIAEGGINHLGSVDLCKKLIDVAADAGADVFKLQKRDIDSCYTKTELDAFRESPFGTTNRELKEQLEFNRDEYDIIIDYCNKKGLEFMASAWDMKSVEFLKKYDLQCYKIPSARLNHIPLLEEIAKQQKYTFISTGMSIIEEVDIAVQIFKNNNCPFELMHCNSRYPMPVEEANLECMNFLKERYNCRVGFSDHGPGLITSLVAASLGAHSIERHITLDRTMYGSDQSASVDPNGFKKLCEWLREIPKTFGTRDKVITTAEWESRRKLWRTYDL